MNTSPKTHFLSEIEAGGPIPEAKLAYLEQRVLNSFYAYVLERFLEKRRNEKFKKADLARRINRGTDVVNRWLASPGNWTIATLTRLLVGICGEEAVLSSSPLVGRVPKNATVYDLLGDDDGAPTVRPPPSTGDSAASYYSSRLERLDA